MEVKLTSNVYFIILGICLLCQCMTPKDMVHEHLTTNSMDIYLCIGQSNMAGRATIELEDQDSLENVFLFTGNVDQLWEKAAKPMNKYSTIRKEMTMQKLGPCYYFAKEISMHSAGRKISIVVNAKGGSSIEEWEGDSTFYKDAIMQARKAMEYGVIKGVIWHQGESNSKKAEDYMPKLKALISALRENLQDPNLAFVAGQLSPDKLGRIKFNDMILKLPQMVVNTGVVTTEKTSTSDKTHFGSKSQRKLGKRYVAEILKLIE